MFVVSTPLPHLIFYAWCLSGRSMIKFLRDDNDSKVDICDLFRRLFVRLRGTFLHLDLIWRASCQMPDKQNEGTLANDYLTWKIDPEKFHEKDFKLKNLKHLDHGADFKSNSRQLVETFTCVFLPVLPREINCILNTICSRHVLTQRWVSWQRQRRKLLFWWHLRLLRFINLSVISRHVALNFAAQNDLLR